MKIQTEIPRMILKMLDAMVRAARLLKLLLVAPWRIKDFIIHMKMPSLPIDKTKKNEAKLVLDKKLENLAIYSTTGAPRDGGVTASECWALFNEVSAGARIADIEAYLESKTHILNQQIAIADKCNKLADLYSKFAAHSLEDTVQATSVDDAKQLIITATLAGMSSGDIAKLIDELSAGDSKLKEELQKYYAFEVAGKTKDELNANLGMLKIGYNPRRIVF